MNLSPAFSARSVILVSGHDAHAFLQGMITNDMDLLASQPAIYAALLTPQGKIIATFFVINNPKGGYWLDCPTGALEILLKRLTMFRLRADVALTDLSEQYQICLSSGQANGICFADPRHSQIGYRVLVERNSPIDPNTVIEITNNRFTLMLAEQDLDYDSNELFPSDINMDLTNGIAWRKGCYVGQEVVSRMKRRGNIRKRIALASFDDQPSPKGAGIIAGTAKLGHICSSDGPLALALVRTDRVIKLTDTQLTANNRPLSLTLPTEPSK